MRLLLDTHIFLWAIAGSPRLKAATRRLIEEADAVYVSAVSIWEVTVKACIGKLDADPHELASAMAASGFAELPVSAAHAAGASHLADHHNAPLDRLLVAQALAEPLKLVTANKVLAKYSNELVLLV